MTNVILQLLQLYLLVLLVRMIFSFFPVQEGSFGAKVYDVVYAVTEPVLAPIRSLIGPINFGGMCLDIAPLVVVVIISIISRVLT